MGLDQQFLLANRVAALGWLLLVVVLFMPAASAWRARLGWVAGRVLPLALAVGYGLTLAASWGSSPGGGFATLEQVHTLFSSRGVVLAGWVHYLAFDLFIGHWMLTDAHQRGHAVGARRWLLLPCLLLCFLFGPLGLLLYFALRPRAAKELPHEA